MSYKIKINEIGTLQKIIESTIVKAFDKMIDKSTNKEMDKTEEQSDLSINDIIKITGLSKNFAYACRFYGEYSIVGKNGLKIRRVRRETFEHRRAQGKPINKECNL